MREKNIKNHQLDTNRLFQNDIQAKPDSHRDTLLLDPFASFLSQGFMYQQHQFAAKSTSLQLSALSGHFYHSSMNILAQKIAEAE